MKKISTYENRKVLVSGLVKSGVSVVKLLHELGALVTVNNGKPFDGNPGAQGLLSLGIKVITGSRPVELLDEGFSLVVRNPGVPYSHLLVARAQEMGIPAIMEVELAHEVAECPIIGTTGTNGKIIATTVTGLLLNTGADQGTARSAGNIGHPAGSVAQEAKSEDKTVMELSSFQLMGIIDFRPHIAAITNTYEAHIDYHGTRKEYVRAKWNFQKDITEKDYLILNWNQSELQELAQRTKACVLPSSTEEVLEDGVYADDYSIYYKKEKAVEISELGVPGKHSVENALATIFIAKLYGISNEAIRETLHFFHGVPRRARYVGEVQGRKFYNNSKAINISATKMVPSEFETFKVVLLTGGLDRESTFDELIPSLKGIKVVVVFSRAKEKLMDTGRKADIKTIVTADSVEQAVPLTLKNSTGGGVVLLSPADTSWDQCPNSETRGNRFMEAVNRSK